MCKVLKEKQIDVHFFQEPDSCSKLSEHYIKLSHDNAGGGYYLVLECNRFALEKEEIEDFCKELSVQMLNLIEAVE